MNKADLEKLGLTAEALEKAGLTADVLDKVIVAHGKDIESHKTKLSTTETEAKGLKDQLTEANKQIESFKGMNVDQIKAAAADWEAKAKKAETDAATAISSLKFDHALEGALSGAKVKNIKTVLPLLNREKLILQDDGTISGLDDQLKPIKEQNDYLFADAKEPPKIVAGGGNQSVITDAFEAAMMRGARIPEAKPKE